uniref:Uncharacterized protein n=1 Tax=Glossina brevipalpis TaxID=37001 RepID=A0A1A9X0L6_9MUSC
MTEIRNRWRRAHKTILMISRIDSITSNNMKMHLRAFVTARYTHLLFYFLTPFQTLRIICLIVFSAVEVSRNGIFGIAVTTPLLGKLQPQPSLAPADTEHAGYVEASLAPILHTTPLITTAALFPAAVTTVQHLPYVYRGKYLTYAVPEVSHYHISY